MVASMQLGRKKGVKKKDDKREKKRKDNKN